MTVTVTNQAELDQAIADGETHIEIDSPGGVWLRVNAPDSASVEARGSASVVAWDSSRVVAWDSASVVARGSASVVAWGSASVVARGSASVEAWGSASVEARDSASVKAWGSASVKAWDSSSVKAWDSSRVEARDSSRVEAWDSSRVKAWGSASVVARGSASVVAWGSASVEARGSASVVAWDSASVVARGSASVEARDSASVKAWGSASVKAWGSASVVAWDSSRVVARGSASVEARDSASVKAGSHVAVHLHSGQATIHGGVLINHTTVDLTNPQQWCDYHGVTITDGTAYVYKAVDKDWTTDRGTLYTPGATPDCPDWRDDNECGGGLHFSPSPVQAREYHSHAARYVRVGVPLEDLRPIVGGTPKCKAPRVVVACVEVDIHGDLIDPAKTQQCSWWWDTKQCSDWAAPGSRYCLGHARDIAKVDVP